VPAYQKLARDIGAERMKEWIVKIGYGNGDISSGLDVFWLPAQGRTTILISAEEQAAMIVRLVTRKLPFSDKTRASLRDLMKTKSTDQGTLYGKTGSAGNAQGEFVLGWFVGFVESKGRTFAFACRLDGAGVMGKDARDATEAILASQGLL
jgi:beta-lactamase class D